MNSGPGRIRYLHPHFGAISQSFTILLHQVVKMLNARLTGNSACFMSTFYMQGGASIYKRRLVSDGICDTLRTISATGPLRMIRLRVMDLNQHSPACTKRSESS